MASPARVATTLEAPLLREEPAPWIAGQPGEQVHDREKLLHRLWKEQRLSSRPLPADDGSRIQVVFPGWANQDRGPDFRGAILATEQGRLLKGDVEVHIHARDWRAHGHHHDPCYDDVILQIAWRGSRALWLQSGERTPSPDSARTSSGRVVPTVCLENLLELPLEVLLLAGRSRLADPRPCVRHAPSPEQVGAILDREGDRRFLAKAAAFAGDAAAMGEEQAFYHGLLDALGYTKNRAAFRELASLVPFRYLREVAQGKPAGLRGPLLQAILLGAAGLLPSQGHSPAGAASSWDAKELERLWLAHQGMGTVRTRWQLFRVRPDNSPPRRVAAAASLAERFLVPGLVGGLFAVIGTGEPAHARRRLYDALMVTGEPGIGGARNPLVGAGRAGEMAVNVALPFLHAWAEARGDDGLARRCLDIYHACPSLPRNHITLEMAHTMLPATSGRVLNSARRLQGLLGLYREQCATLACRGCAMPAPDGGEQGKE